MTDDDESWGVFLEEGPVDWQILPRGAGGFAGLRLAGRWRLRVIPGVHTPATGTVEVRLVREDTGMPVTSALDWSAANTRADGTWAASLAGVPAGGLYRLETRLSPKGNKLGEWSLRGDARHFLGVGDVWLIAGQSNAVGYGRGAYQDAPEAGVHLFRPDGNWSLASHPLADGTGSVFPAIRENYNTGHSPFLHFGRLMKNALGHPIGLIPAALGGSPLRDWLPGGPLFENMIAMAGKAGGNVKGIAWFQGESDAAPGRAETYLERFEQGVAAWRAALDDPRLPILTVQLNRHLSRNPGKEDVQWSLLREAQRQAALRDPRISVVPSHDLPLDDAIHLSSAANMVVAARLADCALGLVEGRDVAYLPPQPVEAAREGERAVRIRFAPVRSRLECMNLAARSFAAEDDSGPIPVEKTVYIHGDTARLTLARKPHGRLRLHGGYGENPDPLPVDVERGMPALAFADFPVTGA